MRRLKVISAVSILALATMAASLAANARTYNEKVIVTFYEPAEIPGGKVLVPGKYTFTVMENTAYRHIVQIFNEDRTSLKATILAIPDYRLTPTDSAVVLFSERPVGSPQAVKGWFYPGEKFGHAFVYPRKRAVELARVTNEPIPATPSELSAELEEPSVTELLERTPITAINPSGEEVPIAEEFPAQTLPDTGSMLPLIALVGMVTMTAALVLRLYTRRRVWVSARVRR
jgi:LPXTG-motif cell wall-anchored protein